MKLRHIMELVPIVVFALVLWPGCRKDAGGSHDGPIAAPSAGTTASDDHSGHDHGGDEHAGHDHAGADDHADDHGTFAAAFIPTKPVAAGDWCGLHGVPEALCARCDPALVEHFKAIGDWCGGHSMPESQCLLCNPTFRAKWEAIAPPRKASRADNSEIKSDAGRYFGRESDPFCQIDRTTIRIDKGLVEKSGIRTEPAARRPMTVSIECPAEIDYDQSNLAHITPRVGGVIERVHASPGDSVAAGDLLAHLESPRLAEAKSRFLELRARVALAQADFDRAAEVSEGTRRMLAQCDDGGDPEDLRGAFSDVRIGEAKSRLLKAHADAELAQAAFDRESSLRAQELSSAQSFENAKRQLRISQAEFHAAHEDAAFAAERAFLEAQKALAIARSGLEVAERALHILGVAPADVQALSDTPGDSLLHYELRSPAAGMVVERHAVVGESVDEDDELFTVVDVSTMWLMLDVQERDLMEMRLGLPVVFAPDGMRGRRFTGTIDWISTGVDERTRTVKARARLENESGLLRAHMFGMARVLLYEDEPMIAVPERAIQTDGCCQLVFVKAADDLFHPRKVTLGANAQGFGAVLAGLREGEEVVTDGSFLMKTEILKGNIGAGCCEVDPGR